jgi:hypothetical protein
MTGEPQGRKLQQTQIKVEIPADLVAQYVNFALITHSVSEIILDFAQILPNTPQARVRARLVMTPTNAKLVHKALGESLAKFEARYGEVKIPPSLADQLFSSTRMDGTSPDEGEGPSNE